MDLGAWWAEMSTLEHIYWLFAIPSSVIFIGQMIMTFIMGDVDGDAGGADADVDADAGIGFQFFTIKNLIGFFTIFAWTGLACIDGGLSTAMTIIVSVIAGLSMMAIMASIFFFMSKLTDSGTLNMNNAIGGVGEVYLTIPANREGFGKVHIKIQGSLRELEAMTDDDEPIKNPTIVSVLEVINDSILLVTRSSNKK